jgi:hypothetical protein
MAHLFVDRKEFVAPESGNCRERVEPTGAGNSLEFRRHFFKK